MMQNFMNRNSNVAYYPMGPFMPTQSPITTRMQQHAPSFMQQQHHEANIQRNLHFSTDWDSHMPIESGSGDAYGGHFDDSLDAHSSQGSSQGSYGTASPLLNGRVHRVNSDGEGMVLETRSGQQIMLCDGVVNYSQCKC